MTHDGGAVQPRHDPTRDAAMSLGTWATRLWGLILILVGLWLFAQVTLGLAVPQLDWDLLWPLGLIAVGAIVVVGALARQRRP